MSHRWLAVVRLAVFTLALASHRATADDKEELLEKQQSQEKARSLAAQWARGVLDVQVRQLQENRLEHLPVFNDVAAMRKNIDQLVEQQMQEVVELLVDAQHAPAADRSGLVTMARTRVREVVLQLVAERQRLHKRLQMSRLSAQTRELIDLQTRVRGSTAALPRQTDERREPAQLAAIQDQTDTQAVFSRLVESLQDAATWGGPVALTAANGLRILRAAEADRELNEALAAIGEGRFADATGNQAAVLGALEALLEEIELARGVSAADREAAMKLVHELLQRQEQLREAARAEDLATVQSEAFVERQTRLHRDLGKLNEALHRFPASEPFVEQSRRDALDAAEHLFGGSRDDAIASQNKVVAQLARIEQLLRDEADLDLLDRSSDDLAAEVALLEDVEHSLQDLESRQKNIVSAAADDPSDAASRETELAGALAELASRKSLPPSIQSALQVAEDEARQAVASERAFDATQQSRSEVRTQLANARRRLMAVEIGELARAAEALERAAAAEREVARGSEEAAREEDLATERVVELIDEQRRIGEIAGNIARGVSRTAPPVAESLGQAAGPLRDVGEQLEQAAKSGNRWQATDTVRNAQVAAGQLEDAAAQLRARQGLLADGLAKLAEEQLSRVTEIHESIQQVQQEASQERPMPPVDPRPSDASESDRVRRDPPDADLRQALERVEAARAEQMRASGREASAETRQQQRPLAELAARQALAEDAARDLAQGRGSASTVTNEQQKVAELALELAGSLSAGIADSVREAGRAAGESARHQFRGNGSKADAARRQVRRHLDAAREQLSAAIRQADQEPASCPDASAQQRVAELLQEATRHAAAASRQTSEALDRSRQAVKTALEEFSGDDENTVRRAQTTASETLDVAASRLGAELEELADQRRVALAETARQAELILPRAAAVDSGAAAALRQARRVASDAAKKAEERKTSAGPLGTVANPATDVARGFEQATANLAAREQQIRRDLEIARTIAELTREQQTARQEIGESAETLADLDDAADADHAGEATAGQIAAARALENATRRFAEAQRATGEGAAEISGQKEVANQPIREGLTTASQLSAALSMEALAANAGAHSNAQDAPEDGPASRATDASDAAVNAAKAAGAQDAAGQSANDGPEKADGDRASEAPAPGDRRGNPTERASPDSQRGGAQAGADEQAGGQQLGTGLVPQSPQVTAARIAGPVAMQRASRMLASASSPEGDDPGASSDQQRSQAPEDGPRGPAVQGDGKSSSPMGNDQPTGEAERGEGRSRESDSRAASEPHDSSAALSGVSQEAWFARLPPALRGAILSKSRRAAPRGYEQRLRRYFESE